MSSNAKRDRLTGFQKFSILLLINCAIFLALLYGFEFYLTQTNPEPKLGKSPPEVKNQYQFREREFAVPKPPGICRIMVLGDSFTWGTKVGGEERYTTILETNLNYAFPYKKFEVLNFGKSGASTTNERDTLQAYQDLVQPDLIVIGFVLNDPQPKRQNYSTEREQFEKKYQERLETLLETMKKLKLKRTGLLMLKALDNLLIKAGVIPTWQVALQRTYEKDSEEWAAFEQALRDIKSMSDQMDLPQPIFAVLNQGVYTDRPTNYNEPDESLRVFLGWYHQAEETAAQLGFNPINYESEFARQLANEVMAVNILDAHPSPSMHRIYAQKLNDEITKYITSRQMCIDDSVSPEQLVKKRP